MRRGATQKLAAGSLAFLVFLITILGGYFDIIESGYLWLLWTLPLVAIVGYILYVAFPGLKNKYSSIVLWVKNAIHHEAVVARAVREKDIALRAAAGWQTKAEDYKSKLEQAMFDHPVQHKNGMELGRKLVVGELLADHTGSTIKIVSAKNEDGKLFIAAEVDEGSAMPPIGSTWLLGTRGQNLLHAVLEVTAFSADSNEEHVQLSVVQVLNTDYMPHILAKAKTYEFPPTLEITYRRFSALEELRKDYSE